MMIKLTKSFLLFYRYLDFDNDQCLQFFLPFFFLCKFYVPGIAIQVCYTAHMHEARLRNPLCPPFHQKHHKTIRTGNLNSDRQQSKCILEHVCRKQPEMIYKKFTSCETYFVKETSQYRWFVYNIKLVNICPCLVTSKVTSSQDAHRRLVLQVYLGLVKSLLVGFRKTKFTAIFFFFLMKILLSGQQR